MNKVVQLVLFCALTATSISNAFCAGDSMSFYVDLDHSYQSENIRLEKGKYIGVVKESFYGGCSVDMYRRDHYPDGKVEANIPAMCWDRSNKNTETSVVIKYIESTKSTIIIYQTTIVDRGTFTLLIAGDTE